MWYLLLPLTQAFDTIDLRIYRYPESSCYAYQCKDSDMIFQPNTCAYFSEDTYYLQPCQNGEVCQQSELSTNSTCTQPVVPTKLKLYPGQFCFENSDCLSNLCQSNMCMGKHWLEDCDDNYECHVGLSCRNDHCWQLLEEDDEGCMSDYDCANDLVCFQWDNSDFGTCKKVGHMKNGSKIQDCDGYYSKNCRNLSCVAPGGIGQGLCIQDITSSFPFSIPCSEDKDCVGHTEQYRFYGNCECGYNKKAQRYCQYFLGDQRMIKLKELLKSWYSSDEIHKCHSMLRNSEECMRNWEHYEEFKYRYYEFKMSPKVQDNDECVRQIYTQDYWLSWSAYQGVEDDDFAKGVVFGLLGLIFMV